MHIPSRTPWRLLLAAAVVVPLAVGVIPLSGAPTTLNAFVQAKMIALALTIGLAAGAWALTRKREDGVFVGTKLRAVAAFALAAVLATIFAIEPRMAVFGDLEQGTGLLAILTCLLALVLVTQLVRGESQAAELTTVVIYTAAGIAVIGLLQQLFLVDLLGYLGRGGPEWMAYRGYGTIGNPDTYAAYLVLPGLLALHRARVTTALRERAIWAAALAVIVTSLVLGFTRGPIAGFAVGALIYAVAAWRSRRSASETAPKRPAKHPARRGRGGRQAMALAASILVIGLVLSFTVGGGSEFVGRLFDLDAIATLGDRGPLWRSALEIAGAHPVLGTGPDSFRLAWYPTRTVEHLAAGEGLLITDPHNVALHIAATMGILGLLAAGYLLWTAVWTGLRSPARTRVADYDGWLFGVIALAITLLASMFAIVLFFMLCLGIGVLLAPALRPRTLRSDAATRMHRYGGATVALLLVTFAVLSAAAQSAAVRVAGADEASAARLAEQAKSLAPWDTRLRDLQNQTMVQHALGRVFSGADDAAATVADAEADLDADRQAEPREYLHHYRSAVLLIGAGQQLGVEHVRRGIVAGLDGIELYPNSLGLRTGVASGYLQLGEPASAAALLADVWDADPSYLPAGGTYAMALLAQGDTARARPVIETLLERFPGDPSVNELEQQLDSSG